MVEVVVIALLVMWSAVYTFKNVFPQSSSRVFNALAASAEQHGFKKLAHVLRPTVKAGCGGGCGCGPSASVKKDSSAEVVKTVKWK